MTDKASLEFLEQQARFFELSGDIACVINAEGYFTQVNAALTRVLGHSKKTLLATPWHSFIHADELPILAKLAAEQGLSGLAIAASHRYRCEDGSYRWLDWRSTEFEQGVAYAVARDATAGKLDEESLHQSEDRARLLMGDVQDHAFVVLDAEGRIVTWNRGAERLNGYNELEIVGRHFSIFYTDSKRTPRDPLEVLHLIAANGKGEDGWSVRKDGSRFWANVIISAIRGLDGTIQGFETLTRDCTQPRRLDLARTAEREELASEVKQSAFFLREVHHRIKNNLQVISSLIKMQARDMPDAPARRALEECNGRVQVLARVHDQLHRGTDYARLPFADYAEHLVHDVFRSSGASSRGIELELKFESVDVGASQAICCGLILNELVTNALKHAFPGDRRGHVTARFERSNGEELLLRVEDDGVGSSACRPPGRTMGLRLVDSLVQQLGGRMTIERERGTAFEILFPLEQPSRAPQPVPGEIQGVAANA